MKPQNRQGILGLVLALTPCVAGAQIAPTPSAPGVIRLRVGPDGNAAGILVANPAKPGPVIMWLHGGMRSSRTDKGWGAVGTLKDFLPPGKGLLCSPSAYYGSDWLQPSGLAHMDALLDTVAARFPRARLDSLILVGVSDGCLGALYYAAAGRRKPARFVLFSANPGLVLSADRLRADPAFNATRWDVFQGGRDRLFPSGEVFPLLKAWARANPKVKLHLYPEGEHDFGWYAEHTPREIRAVFK